MTSAEDWKSFLENKVADRNPKCGNCRHWRRLLSVASAIGSCSKHSDATDYGVTMTDLNVCSAWEPKAQ